MSAKDTEELINADLVRQAINRLIEPGAVFEIRALEAKLKGGYRAGIVSGYFDSVQTVLKALSSIVSAKGIYITLNPVLPDLLARRCNRLDYVGKDATTADNGIIKRRWLLIDADPRRPAGISATDQEKRHAATTARDIHDLLTTRGWPEPVLADSGNGWHLDYRIDIPADDRGLAENVLKALAAKFDSDHCTVDVTCANAARIVKLYGTLACKGDSTATRPHRMSKIVKAPDPVAVVSREQLETLANELALPAKTTAGATVSNAKHGRNGTFDVDGFLRDYNIAIKADHTKNGVRVIELPSCPFNADHGGHGEVAVFVQPGGKLGFKCHHASCKDKGWREFRGHFEPGCYDGKTPTSALDAKSVETGKPFVMLPHGPFPISDAGRALGKLLADTKLFHLRGGGIVKLVKDTDGFPYLHDVRPAALASDFENVARLMKMGKNKPEPATCSEQTARLIAASTTFRDPTTAAPSGRSRQCSRSPSCVPLLLG